ncbi:hypothetical protein [Pedobacter sp. JCM 36344]|uniref:hypothetical protein n=1 Tax=Pedobacter sp. JCM 36344 TaxID=3374280 RepID=UPI00397A6186
MNKYKEDLKQLLTDSGVINHGKSVLKSLFSQLLLAIILAGILFVLIFIPFKFNLFQNVKIWHIPCFIFFSIVVVRLITSKKRSTNLKEKTEQLQINSTNKVNKDDVINQLMDDLDSMKTSKKPNKV